MKSDKDYFSDYFFCGIGGSGMLPLAMILKARGCRVEGSDRSLDQGRTPDKFDFLRARGIELHAQDGSGLTRPSQTLVTSGAVEDTVPDVLAAKKLGLDHVMRPGLLSKLFNAADVSIGVAGTSGKSTTTGMIGWIFEAAGRSPTIVNGAVMKNFVTADMPFASAAAGDENLFISEVDESDGSIASYSPTIAVLNNIAVDHKTIEELRELFSDFVAKSQKAVLNLDNGETKTVFENQSTDDVITYSLSNPLASFIAKNLQPQPEGISFDVTETASGETARVELKMPGAHNVSNALAAISAACACDISLEAAASALSSFAGIRRRLELVGTVDGVTVIDDFAHNPDKIAASLKTLRSFPGRLLIMFQPHGFGPLRLMKDGFISCFAEGMGADDVLIMPEPVYFGGTVERTVTSGDIAEGIRSKGKAAEALVDRDACGARLRELMKPGDRVIIMGARDDTLSTFAQSFLT